MTMTYTDIRNDILENWERLQGTASQEDLLDLLNELADSACPVYYSDIIKEWQELPSDFTDSWRDNGIQFTEEDATILKLMSLDLYFYYENQYNTIFTDIRLEKEEELNT